MSFWGRIFGRKASESRQVLVMNQVGRPVSTPKNYEAFAEQGYQINVIAYKCVSVLSRACAAVKWNAYRKNEALESHPIIDLLNAPNPMQSKAAFFEATIAYYEIAGNSYIEAVKPNPKMPPLELWPIRPDKVQIIPGALGLPQAFIFKGASAEKVFTVDQITGNSNILHMKTFHPTNPWYGMSPIEAAVYSIDQHNEAAKWNLSLLQNMGTPSGALVVKQDERNPSGTLEEPQYVNLKKQLDEKYAGGKNAGRMMLLEGGLDWKQMGFNSKDMDWLEGRKMAARDVALAFGVPPIILNIPGDSTFANFKEARFSMYEDTIIPLLDLLKDELNHWLVPMFNDATLSLDYDKDSIEALTAKRAEKMSFVNGLSFLTINEKREMSGFEEVEGGDELYITSSQIPIGEVEEEEVVVEEEEPVVEEEKQVNLLNSSEKKRAWREMNEARKKLSNAMYQDLIDDFNDQADELKKATTNIDKSLLEFAALKVLSDNTKLEATLQKHIKRSLLFFGNPILEGGKFFSPDIEKKSTVKFNQFAASFVKKRTAEAIQQIEGTSIKKARKIIKDVIAESLESGESIENIGEELRSKFSTLSKSRSETIARTEIAVASNEGALEAARELGIPDLEKEWVSVNDDRTRHNPDVADHLSANGQTVGINEKFFINPDTTMDGPGDASAPPEQVINCRCVTVFKRAGKTFVPSYEVI